MSQVRDLSRVSCTCRAAPCCAVRPAPPRVLCAPFCGEFFWDMGEEEAFMMLRLISLSSSTSMPISASRCLDFLRSPIERALARLRLRVKGQAQGQGLGSGATTARALVEG